MDLGKHVVDKEILDVHGLRAGKVDDLQLVISGGDGTGLPEAEVTAIVSGPLALAQHLPGWVRWLARHLYRLLGVADPHPVVIPWERVVAIDVVVHVDVDRDELGLQAVQEAATRRFIGRLPGA